MLFIVRTADLLDSSDYSDFEDDFRPQQAAKVTAAAPATRRSQLSVVIASDQL
ncbi:MAG: hypothetical protein ACRYF0_16415 [Janthinobacterium lividum]